MSWADLVKGGCGWVHAVTVSGLPYVFVERNPPRVDATTPAAAPSGFDSVCECLQVTDGMTASVKIERFEGFGSGDALDVVLSFDGLNESGILDQLFRNASKFLVLAADMDHTTGNKYVQSLTDWVGLSHEYGHIGTERIKMSSTTAASGGIPDYVTISERGLAGSLASDYTRRSPTFSIIADRPMVWRGRSVTLWRHLVSPEGRIIDATWCHTGSTYGRVLWRGYVDAPPRNVSTGFLLRSLPLMRRPALPIGQSMSASVYQVFAPEAVDTAENQVTYDESAGEALGGLPVHVPPGAQIGTFSYRNNRYADTSGASADQESTGMIVLKDTHPDGFFTLSQLVRTIYSATGSVGAYITEPMLDTITGDVGDVIEGDNRCGVSFGPDGPYLWLELKATEYRPNFPHCWVTINQGAGYPFIPGTYGAVAETQFLGAGTGWSSEYGEDWIYFTSNVARYQIPLSPVVHCFPGTWMPVTQTEGNEWQDVQFAASGYAEAEVSGTSHVIRWDQSVNTFNNVTTPALVMLRVSSWVTSGAGVPHLAGAKLTVLAGVKGSISNAMLTLMESSGSGNRGTYDTLALAQGCGIHEDLINEPSLARPGLAASNVDLFTRGRTSVAELVGGHTALRSLCLVQRCTDPDTTESGATMPGDCQLAVVDVTTTLVDDSALEIGIGEVVLEAIEAPESAEVPNVITINLSPSTGNADESIVVQDLPRIMAEGPRDQSWNAPKMSIAEALQLGASILAQGDGQMIVTMRVAPWVEIQPGDPVKLTIGHPMVYDWTTATRAPSSIGAKCVGWSADLVSGMQRVTLLLAGPATGVGYLCPSVSVVSKDSTTQVTIAAIDAQWFTADDWCRIYNPGEEQGPIGGASPEAAAIQIDSVSAASARIIFKTTLPSWVAAGTIVTYPLTSNTDRQGLFTHNSVSHRLG